MRNIDFYIGKEVREMPRNTRGKNFAEKVVNAGVNGVIRGGRNAYKSTIGGIYGDNTRCDGGYDPRKSPVHQDPNVPLLNGKPVPKGKGKGFSR